MPGGKASALCNLFPQCGFSLGPAQRGTESGDSYILCSLFKANKEAPTCNAESVILLPAALPILNFIHVQLFQRQQFLRKKNTPLFRGAARRQALQLTPLCRRRLEVQTGYQQVAGAHGVRPQNVALRGNIWDFDPARCPEEAGSAAAWAPRGRYRRNQLPWQQEHFLYIPSLSVLRETSKKNPTPLV